MILKYLSLFEQIPFWKEVGKKDNIINLAGLGGVSSKSFFVSGIANKINKPVLWLTEDASQILEIASNTHIWTKIPIIGITEDSEEKEISNVLAWTKNKIPSLVVSTPEIIKQHKCINSKNFTHKSLVIAENQKIKLIDFFDNLMELGYESSVGNLEVEGTYFRRGGIVDIFPIGASSPVRVELFGDAIQSITTFDIATGKPKEGIDEVTLYPLNISGDSFITDYYKDFILILDEMSSENDYNYKANYIFQFHPFIGEDTFDCGFSSVLRYNSPLGFIGDLKEKIKEKWKVVIFAKDRKLVDKLLKDNKVRSISRRFSKSFIKAKASY